MLESITSVLRKVDPALRSRSTSHFIDYLLIILTFCQDSLLSTKFQRDPNISVINKLWCWARAEIYFSQNFTFCWEWRMLFSPWTHFIKHCVNKSFFLSKVSGVMRLQTVSSFFYFKKVSTVFIVAILMPAVDAKLPHSHFLLLVLLSTVSALTLCFPPFVCLFLRFGFFATCWVFWILRLL